MQILLGVAFAFASAIFWAGASVALRSVSTRLDVFLISSMRAIFALLFLVPMVAITGGLEDYRLLSGTRLLYLLGSIILGGFSGDILYTTSLKLLGISRAFPIASSQPVFTLLFSALILKERITWPMIVGMMLVLAGVYLIARPREHVVWAVDQPRKSIQMLRGTLMALGAAAFWGLSTVFLSLGVEGINSFTATSVRVLTLAILASMGMIWRGCLGSLRQVDRNTFLLLLLIGILSWGLSASSYTAAIQLAGPSKTAIINATAPLFAIPLSMIFLREKPTSRILAGTALTIVGVILVV